MHSSHGSRTVPGNTRDWEGEGWHILTTSGISDLKKMVSLGQSTPNSKRTRDSEGLCKRLFIKIERQLGGYRAEDAKSHSQDPIVQVVTKL